MELGNWASWLTLLSTWRNLELSEKTGSVKEFPSSDRARCLRLRKGLWVAVISHGIWTGGRRWVREYFMVTQGSYDPVSSYSASWACFWGTLCYLSIMGPLLALQTGYWSATLCTFSWVHSLHSCKHREGDGERDQEIQPGPWAGTSCLNTIRAGPVQLLRVSQEWLFSVWGCGGWREEESKDVPFSIGVEDAICSTQGAIPSSWEWIRSVFDSEVFISSWRTILCKTAVTRQPAVKEDRHGTFPVYGFFLPNHLTHLLGWGEPCWRRQLAMYLG